MCEGPSSLPPLRLAFFTLGRALLLKRLRRLLLVLSLPIHALAHRTPSSSGIRHRVLDPGRAFIIRAASECTLSHEPLGRRGGHSRCDRVIGSIRLFEVGAELLRKRDR